MGEEELMTVGKLARRVGVTVRTIQFYDQKGLLSPTKVSPSNQRLYSKADEAELYRIIVLKRLGLTLSQIRATSCAAEEDLRRLTERSRGALDAAWLRLIKGLSALYIIEDGVSAEKAVDWEAIAKRISQADEGVEARWENGLFASEAQPEDPFPRKEMVAWHALMADTIAAMNEGAAPESSRGQALAKRYQALGGDKRAETGLAQMAKAFQEMGGAMPSPAATPMPTMPEAERPDGKRPSETIPAPKASTTSNALQPDMEQLAMGTPSLDNSPAVKTAKRRQKDGLSASDAVTRPSADAQPLQARVMQFLHAASKSLPSAD